MLPLLVVGHALGVQLSGVRALFMLRPVERLTIAEEWDTLLMTKHISYQFFEKNSDLKKIIFWNLSKQLFTDLAS